jgi:hypothetical protein
MGAHRLQGWICMSHDNVYKSILLIPHSEYQGLFPSIAEGLKKRYDARLVLACKSIQEKELYQKKHPGLFDAVYHYRFYEGLFENPGNTHRLAKQAGMIEKRYGLLFSHLFADDRHLGLGFSPGGINFPRSVFSRKADYWPGLNALIKLIEYYEQILDQHEVTLVINPTKALAQICSGRGIPVRIFTSTRYENYYYWAVNDVLESNLIADEFSRLEGVECDDTLKSQPQYYIESSRDALKSFGLKRTAKMAGYEIARRAWHQYKGYEKARGYLLRDNVCAHLRIYRQARNVRKLFKATLKDLQKHDFIYFPLGVEPERSLTRDSPEFSHQGFALQSIAQNSPAGMLIAVKEHITAIGPRPTDFYKGLSLISNTVLVDIMQPSLELIQQSRAVATVTGTAGLEAAFMGVPVLSFGKHNIYNIVPHVIHVASWLDIDQHIHVIMSDWENRADKRRQDGSRFLRAMKNISVDCGDTDFSRPIVPELLDGILIFLETTFKKEEALQ